MSENFFNLRHEEDEICNSQPISLPSSKGSTPEKISQPRTRPPKYSGQRGQFRSIEEIDAKYRHVFKYPYFNLVQSSVIDDALYSDKSMVVCAPTGSGKTVIFEMAILQLLMELEDKNNTDDFKIIYMAPVKALCTERITEWYSKFTKLGLLCIEVTGDTDVDFPQLKPYRIIITTPEKWDMLTRRWMEHNLVKVVKLLLIDEVHILNDEARGPVLEAVVSRMKTVESSARSGVRMVAVSATISNPQDVAAWLGAGGAPAVHYNFGDECRPVRLTRVVEGYPCPSGTSIFKFDIILNYKLWPIIQKYHNGKPTLIFCNTRKSVMLTAETLSREITISLSPEQRGKLTALASTIKNKKIQSLVVSGVGCHHAGLLYEERANIEQAFRNRDLPILITTTTLAMGVNLPAHLVIIKNTQQYVNGAYQEYSVSTVLQMVGRAGRPQYDSQATAVIMTRMNDKVFVGKISPRAAGGEVGAPGSFHFRFVKSRRTNVVGIDVERLPAIGYKFCLDMFLVSHVHFCSSSENQQLARYQSLVGGCEPLQSFLHKRLAENINSEIALGTIRDVAQCVGWVSYTFLKVRAARDPHRYLGLHTTAPAHLITNKIEELCVKAMNGLERSGLVTMDELSCIESTEAGRLMSLHYLDLETMKLIMKIGGTETLEQLLWLVCESHELSDMHLRVDERRCLNTLNRNNSAPTIRYQIKGKISSRQMKLNCIIQSVLGCLPIPDPSLNQEALKIMRTADRVCKCLVSYVTRPNLISQNPKFYAAILNSLILAKCITAHLWENSLYVSRQLRGIGPTFSTLLVSAGKTNFMLLDESHPRDLERIMNKGPPAGNILRKQISLLPKYNVTITPINEQSIRVQLSLLNQSYLSENIESLTAGARHKSYIVVGDSENVLLYFSTFKDSDLINIYDGNISFEVTRKHLHEHKVIAHCVSSSFVGIDDQCEHLFKDINPFPSCIEKTTHNETLRKISPNRQTYITDVFKERKRKSNDSDSTHFQDKKKRDSLLIDKFKILNKSFEKTSKDIKEKCNAKVKSVIGNLAEGKPQYTPKITEPNVTEVNLEIDENYLHDDFEFDDIDNEQINHLLNEIEGEVNKPSTSKKYSIFVNAPIQNNCNNKLLTNNNSKIFNKVNMNTKNNYTFIDRLEEKNSEYENDNLASNKESGFSDTIKCHIQQYLQKAQNNIKSTIVDSIELDENYNDSQKLTILGSEKTVPEEDLNSINVTTSENKKIGHENNIGIRNQTPESKETILNNFINPQIITDISRENLDIIDLSNLSPHTSNFKRIESAKSPETELMMPLENSEYTLTHIENKLHTTDTNADKIICNIEDKEHSSSDYSLTPYVPRIISPKSINNSPKKRTFNTSTDAFKLKETSSDNFHHSNFFSADCALIPFDQKFVSSTSMNTKEIHTFQKSFNIYNANVNEKHDDLNKSTLSLHSEQNNSDINIKNPNAGKKIKNIKKYSFNSAKTIGVHNENISKICTWKVALDVTEIVHKEDNKSDSQHSKNKIQDVDDNILSNFYDIDNVLQIENNIKNVKSLETSNMEKKLNKQLQITKPPGEISDKSISNTHSENKKATLKDILERYATRENVLEVQDIDMEKCSTERNKIIKKPELKPKRKYRISDLDSIDVSLPETLVPSQNQFNATPVTYKSNDSKPIRREMFTEKKLKPCTIIESGIPPGITCVDEDLEDYYKEEPKIDLNSYLEEPAIISDFDISPAELDPKTLLQSLNNEEILPPPPEFCDNDVPTMILDPNTSNYNDSPGDNNIPATSLDDNFRSSTETNTWTFSRKHEDYVLCNPDSSYNDLIPKNSIANNESDFLESRLSILSQFKFKRKEMLRK